jgi:hypothetical protein
MFDRIRKAFSREGQGRDDAAGPNSQLGHGPVSEWAGTHGFTFSTDAAGKGMALEGQVSGKPWRLQLGRPSRKYMRGEEIRARAELELPEEVAVLIMNRPLRDALEKQAYEIYTDPLQTSVHPKLPEEMRWLAMFDEVGWESLPKEFSDRYAILAGHRDYALAWLDPPLIEATLNWPVPGPSAQVPFMLLLLRGKAYLRMEYTPSDPMTLQHAALVFTRACDAALSGLRPKAPGQPSPGRP